MPPPLDIIIPSFKTDSTRTVVRVINTTSQRVWEICDHIFRISKILQHSTFHPHHWMALHLSLKSRIINFSKTMTIFYQSNSWLSILKLKDKQLKKIINENKYEVFLEEHGKINRHIIEEILWNIWTTIETVSIAYI